ncbi:hypothetical protein RRG08_046821 [Elysia crispata]|uniref:Uncharacterized protein n=1 Tax=Elysia crispata TaxID=231223 RepID=A0AAE0ZMT2_9GAST|nr:hypothetical protein RRG08_046821 [Elysia crispata]
MKLKVLELEAMHYVAAPQATIVPLPVNDAKGLAPSPEPLLSRARLGATTATLQSLPLASRLNSTLNHLSSNCGGSQIIVCVCGGSHT